MVNETIVNAGLNMGGTSFGELGLLIPVIVFLLYALYKIVPNLIKIFQVDLSEGDNPVPKFKEKIAGTHKTFSFFALIMIGIASYNLIRYCNSVINNQERAVLSILTIAILTALALVLNLYPRPKELEKIAKIKKIGDIKASNKFKNNFQKLFNCWNTIQENDDLKDQIEDLMLNELDNEYKKENKLFENIKKFFSGK